MDILQTFLGMAGAGALVAAIVGVLKLTPLVNDGDSGNWSAALSIVGVVVLFVLKIVNPEVDLSALDESAAMIADLLIKITLIAVQLGLPKLFYKLFKGLPVIGASFSAE